MSRSLARRGLLGVLVVSLWCPAIIARAQDAVSLERVLAHADAHAPLILAARARLEEGGAARRGADRLLTDPLSVELGGGPRIADGTGSDFDMVVALTQPIEVAGERGLRIEAADRLSARRGAELEAVRWQVHREIHFAYHQAIEAQREWLAFTERLLEIARGRVSAGDVGPLELAIAEAELAGARQRLVEAEARALDTRLAMAELAGWRRARRRRSATSTLGARCPASRSSWRARRPSIPCSARSERPWRSSGRSPPSRTARPPRRWTSVSRSRARARRVAQPTTSACWSWEPRFRSGTRP